MDIKSTAEKTQLKMQCPQQVVQQIRSKSTTNPQQIEVMEFGPISQ